MALLGSRLTGFLNRTLPAAGGVSVLYLRSGVSYPVTAVPADPRADAEQTTPPARVEWTERDYLILAADLLAAGVSGTPAVGDRVTETTAAGATTWEVSRRGTEPAWRWADTAETVYRLHCKRA